jgi:hypothetical protein
MKSPMANQPSLPVWRTKAAWLASIPALIILCLAAVPGQQAGQGFVESDAPQLEGSWLVTVTLDVENGPPPFEVLVSYAAGGVAICSDPSVYPLCGLQVAQTAYQGAWAKTRGREYSFTMIGFQWDETGPSPVMWKGIIKEELAVEPGGDAYHGKGTVENYYADGEYAGAVGTTTHGVRIKPH